MSMTLEQVRDALKGVWVPTHWGTDGRSYKMSDLIESLDLYISQPHPVAQGHVSDGIDGDTVLSFANETSIYSIVKHDEGHQLVHTEGGALKLISKPFTLVAQGEAVGWKYRCNVEGTGTKWLYTENIDVITEIDGNADWDVVELHTAAPTTPTGHRVVPVEPTEAMVERGKMAHHEADDLARDQYELGTKGMSFRANRAKHVYKAMLAAAPDAGGV